MSIDIAAFKQEVGLEPYDKRLNPTERATEDAETPKLIRIAQRPSELSTKPIEWIIEGVYPKHGLSIVAGREGIGKGNHALLSIAAILSGGRFLGQPTQKVPVIYVDLENPEAVIRDRLQRLDLMESEDFWVWGQWNEIPPPANLDHPIYLEAAEKTGALFYFDSLIDFAECMNENDASEISSVLLKARHLARRCAGVNIQHHADKYGKSGWRGNTAIPAAADMAWGLKEKGSGNLEFITIKAKMAPKTRFEYRTSFDGNRLTYQIIDGGKPQPKQSQLEAAIEVVRQNGGINVATLKGQLQSLANPKFTKREAEHMVTALRPYCRIEAGKKNSTLYWIQDVGQKTASLAF